MRILASPFPECSVCSSFLPLFVLFAACFAGAAFVWLPPSRFAGTVSFFLKIAGAGSGCVRVCVWRSMWRGACLAARVSGDLRCRFLSFVAVCPCCFGSGD